MRVLWVFLTMLEGWIGSIWSIDNLDWSLLIWDNSVWFFFAFGLYIGDAVWASSLSLSWSSFLVVLFVLLIRRLTIFNALTFARWYALTVFSPRDLKRKRHFYTMPEKLHNKKIQLKFTINHVRMTFTSGIYTIQTMHHQLPEFGSMLRNTIEWLPMSHQRLDTLSLRS